MPAVTEPRRIKSVPRAGTGSERARARLRSLQGRPRANGSLDQQRRERELLRPPRSRRRCLRLDLRGQAGRSLDAVDAQRRRVRTCARCAASSSAAVTSSEGTIAANARGHAVAVSSRPLVRTVAIAACAARTFGRRRAICATDRTNDGGSQSNGHHAEQPTASAASRSSRPAPARAAGRLWPCRRSRGRRDQHRAPSRIGQLLHLAGERSSRRVLTRKRSIKQVEPKRHRARRQLRERQRVASRRPVQPAQRRVRDGRARRPSTRSCGIAIEAVDEQVSGPASADGRRLAPAACEE